MFSTKQSDVPYCGLIALACGKQTPIVAMHKQYFVFVKQSYARESVRHTIELYAGGSPFLINKTIRFILDFTSTKHCL